MISVLLALAFTVSLCHAPTVNDTVTPFSFSFLDGESFCVQDDLRSESIVFSVSGGSLEGNGSLVITASNGTLTINNDNSCTLTIDYNLTGLLVFVNGTKYLAPISMESANQYVIVWRSVIWAIIPISSSGLQYYFRSDEYTTLNVTAYGFDSDFGNTATNLNVSTSAAEISYGFRVWILHYTGTTSELTSGTPIAVLTRSLGSGFQNESWSCPERTLILGYDALKIGIYLSQDGGEWVSQANFVSPVIISTQLQATTWNFTAWTYFDGNQTSFTFGNTQYKSGISGISFKAPLESEIQAWRIGRGDVVGFMIGSYTDQIGSAFYVLMILMIAAVFYFRTSNFGVVVFLFVLFGGANGIMLILLPGWAIAGAVAFVVLGIAFIIYRAMK
jgi:hypothetical protein